LYNYVVLSVVLITLLPKCGKLSFQPSVRWLCLQRCGEYFIIITTRLLSVEDFNGVCV